jgi:acyl carrier protein
MSCRLAVTHLDGISGSPTREVLMGLQSILVERLRFAEGQVVGREHLDSLDFIELSLGIEERFGVLIEEADLSAHFPSLDALADYVRARLGMKEVVT